MISQIIDCSTPDCIYNKNGYCTRCQIEIISGECQTYESENN